MLAIYEMAFSECETTSFDVGVVFFALKDIFSVHESVVPELETGLPLSP